MYLTEGNAGRKRMSVRISKEETLLLVRGYLLYPVKWVLVIGFLRRHLAELPADAQRLYGVATTKQLRERISTKLGKLLTCNANLLLDDEIK